MTFYRILPDRINYQLMTISSKEIIEKLGKQNPFHIDPTPKPYALIWQPLEISFYNSISKKKKVDLPDITIDHGRLFLNEKAANALESLISADGEILPVTYSGAKGAIFNTLKYVEKFNALDTKISLKDSWGDLQSLAFIEERIIETTVLKCQFEGFTGLFCNDHFKLAVEKHGLNGIVFNTDLANIFPADTSAKSNAKQ